MTLQNGQVVEVVQTGQLIDRKKNDDTANFFHPVPPLVDVDDVIFDDEVPNIGVVSARYSARSR